MYSLKDKVVVVTGSGRGIGRAIAVRLAKEGSLLVV
ncbi:short chain dehydrogenase, partial [Sulfolobus sp. F1]